MVNRTKRNYFAVQTFHSKKINPTFCATNTINVQCESTDTMAVQDSSQILVSEHGRNEVISSPLRQFLVLLQNPVPNFKNSPQ